MKTDKKLVLITGGDKGIGRAIVSKLAKSHYHVAFTYHKNRNDAYKLEENHSNVKAYQFTLGERKNVERLLQQIEIDFGIFPSYLVNNAATLIQKEFEQIDDDEWRSIINTNLTGVFQLTQELIGRMKQQRFGRIVNISSIGGQIGGNLAVHYATSKAGIISFTKSMAKIYSEYNVLTNCIAPGLVDTEMIRGEISTKEGQEKIESIPVGKITEPEEIARLCKFLLSSKNKTITGQTININGGMYFG